MKLSLSWQFIDKIKQDIKDKQIPLTIYRKPSDLYDLIQEKEEAF